MSKFFFFTDIDLIQQQNSSDSFGPVSSTDSDFTSGTAKYRLISFHTATSNPLAYAICNGQLFVQQDNSDPTLINIVLKPDEQPEIGLPKIKYFIYHGILKNSLTDGVNIINGNNTLTTHILNHNPITPQRILGIDMNGTNYSDADPVDNAFYLSKPDFELWKVFGGWSIGSFDMNRFGLEIVLENSGYEIDFSVVRKNSHTLNLIIPSSSPSQGQLFEFETKKEEVLNYLDPCAFFGMFYNNSIFARSSIDSTDNLFVHEFFKKTGDEIYRDIIEGGTISNPKNIFANRNTVYIDIRNEYGNSFNYFNNLNNSIKISFVNDTLEPIDLYDYYDSGWPILQLNSMPGGEDQSTIKISFPTFPEMKPLLAVLSGKRKKKFKGTN